MMIRALAACAVGLALAGCGGSGGTTSGAATEPSGTPRSITVTSPAFSEGRPVPTTYTCRGKGSVPDLAWSGVPQDARDLALVVDDPDAPGGGYVHWIVLGIPATADGIEAGHLPDGATEIDASGGPGWTPPCPPSGTHHYRFTVYAFPSTSAFALGTDAAMDDVLATIADQAVAWGRLTGTVTAD